uniref:Endonuclease n=1 Tax=Prevotella sp. GTC17253 TaxID=3236793 RepID=A0AB33IN58_9BACT
MALLTLLLSIFTFVELNTENLFDTQHDSLKNDTEFLPESYHYWNAKRYWNKLNHIGQEIIACGGDSAGWSLPDMVALCEVENDTVMRDLTKRSLLSKARYEYFMTDSPDERGIDVALLYSPFSFRPIQHRSIRIQPIEGMRLTRDILYVSGQLADDDTLHVFVVHAPSRSGGEVHSRPFRMVVAERLISAVDSIRALSPDARIIVAGDFNDYVGDKSLVYIGEQGLQDVSENATGTHGAKGTYRYKGMWGSLDHIFCSRSMQSALDSCYIFDAPFLLTDDERYGGVQPRRNFNGAKYNNGFSDHLPLVARFRIGVEE